MSLFIKPFMSFWAGEERKPINSPRKVSVLNVELCKKKPDFYTEIEILRLVADIRGCEISEELLKSDIDRDEGLLNQKKKGYP